MHKRVEDMTPKEVDDFLRSNDMDLSHLTHQEKLAIVRVLKRDEKLLTTETSRVLKLKSEVQELKRKSALRDGQSNDSTCVRCQSQLGFVLNPGAECVKCRFIVCRACRVVVTEDGATWLCILCAKQAKLRTISGEWFYEKLTQRLNPSSPAQLHGSTFARESLRRSSKSKPTSATNSSSFINRGSGGGGGESTANQNAESTSREAAQSLPPSSREMSPVSTLQRRLSGNMDMLFKYHSETDPDSPKLPSETNVLTNGREPTPTKPLSAGRETPETTLSGQQPKSAINHRRLTKDSSSDGSTVATGGSDAARPKQCRPSKSPSVLPSPAEAASTTPQSRDPPSSHPPAGGSNNPERRGHIKGRTSSGEELTSSFESSRSRRHSRNNSQGDIRLTSSPNAPPAAHPINPYYNYPPEQDTYIGSSSDSLLAQSHPGFPPATAGYQSRGYPTPPDSAPPMMGYPMYPGGYSHPAHLLSASLPPGYKMPMVPPPPPAGYGPPPPHARTLVRQSGVDNTHQLIVHLVDVLNKHTRRKLAVIVSDDAAAAAAAGQEYGSPDNSEHAATLSSESDRSHRSNYVDEETDDRGGGGGGGGGRLKAASIAKQNSDEYEHEQAHAFCDMIPGNSAYLNTSSVGGGGVRPPINPSDNLAPMPGGGGGHSATRGGAPYSCSVPATPEHRRRGLPNNPNYPLNPYMPGASRRRGIPPRGYNARFGPPPPRGFPPPSGFPRGQFYRSLPPQHHPRASVPPQPYPWPAYATMRSGMGAPRYEDFHGSSKSLVAHPSDYYGAGPSGAVPLATPAGYVTGGRHSNAASRESLDSVGQGSSSSSRPSRSTKRNYTMVPGSRSGSARSNSLPPPEDHLDQFAPAS